MKIFHGIIIKYLNCVLISSEYAKLFFYLIVWAQIWNLFLLIVPVSSLLVFIVPFYCSIAIAYDIIVCGLWLPPEGSAWKPTHSRCISNSQDFPFIQIIYFNLSICTSYPHYLLFFVDFDWKNFGINIPKKVNNSTMAIRSVSDLNLSRFKLLLLLYICIIHNVLNFLHRNSLFWLI